MSQLGDMVEDENFTMSRAARQLVRGYVGKLPVVDPDIKAKGTISDSCAQSRRRQRESKRPELGR